MTPGTADEQDAERLASSPAERRNRDPSADSHDLQPAPVEGSWAHGSASGLHCDARRTRDADDPASAPILPDPCRRQWSKVAYLVVLEALNNVVGHAHANQSEVFMTLAPGELVLRVVDDGVGLVSTVRKRDWHHLNAKSSPGTRRHIRPQCRARWRDLASGADSGGTVTPIRLVVVDDHMVFREGLRALLGRVDDIEIVGEAANTQDAVEVTEAVRPDVVLMDLDLPGGGGEVATTTILAAHPEVAVLVLTMHSDDAHLRHALHAGARGYLLKDAEPDALIRAIVAVNEGQAIFDQGIAPRVIAATGASHAERPFPATPARIRDLGPARPRAAKRRNLSADGHQHQDGAEQCLDDLAQARRRRPRAGRGPRP